MFVGYGALLYVHLGNQNYYSRNLNRFYSGLWTSMTLQSFVFVIFTLVGGKPQYYVFFPIFVIGFILGWILNKFYISWYSKRIYRNIKRKFNQLHVIEKIKEKKEYDEYDDSVEKSLVTIGIY